MKLEEMLQVDFVKFRVILNEKFVSVYIYRMEEEEEEEERDKGLAHRERQLTALARCFLPKGLQQTQTTNANWSNTMEAIFLDYFDWMGLDSHFLVFKNKLS